jgi:hypothetical protein
MHVPNTSAYHLISGRKGVAGGPDVPDGSFAGYLASASAAAEPAVAADRDPVYTASLAAFREVVADRQHWVSDNFRRTGADLIADLSAEDRASLQGIVNSGQMTWDDVQTALEAKIKTATTEQLSAQKDQLDKMPASWQKVLDAQAASQSWDRAMMEGRSAIMKAFLAAYDAVMANNPGPVDGTDIDPHALQKLTAGEGTLDRCREIRDRDLADLEKRLGPKPRMPAFPVGGNPFAVAMFEARPTLAETTAANKLAQAGFVPSESFGKSLDNLVGEITANVGKATTQPAFTWDGTSYVR